MELICPSCEARYQVPDSSIGEKGRQVSCMSCGNSWHAFTPLILGSPAAPPTTAAPGIDFQAPPRPGRSSAAFAPAEAEAPPTAPRPPEPPRVPDPSRSEQLAEIREMLAEVQSEERAAAALVPDDDYRTRVAPGAQPGPAQPEPGGVAAAPAPQAPADEPWTRPAPAAEDDEDDDASDPLRRRMARHDREGDRAGPDVGRLRKRHDRRARREQRARDIGSGAFLTGFLLIVMIAAAMTAIYVLHPQIIARMPGSGPMLAEYVETVDGLRLSVAEGFESARSWFMDLIDKSA